MDNDEKDRHKYIQEKGEILDAALNHVINTILDPLPPETMMTERMDALSGIHAALCYHIGIIEALVVETYGPEIAENLDAGRKLNMEKGKTSVSKFIEKSQEELEEGTEGKPN